MARTHQASRKVEKEKTRRRSRSRSRSRERQNATAATTTTLAAIPTEPLKGEVINTKLFTVSFEDQKKCQAEAKNSPFLRCQNCEAIMTTESKVATSEEYARMRTESSQVSDEAEQKFIETSGSVWICEFCMAHNAIPNEFVLVPGDNPCYVLTEGKGKAMEEQDSGQMLVFCIDVSESMEMEVRGRKNRLECVIEGVVDELKKLRIDRSTKKVGIVWFGGHVTILGDASKQQKRLPNELFGSFERIVEKASEYASQFVENATDSYSRLTKAVREAICHGSTALGPALVTSIEIASKGAVGSRVIICTDGEANVGIGAGTDSAFYDRVALFAKQKQVSVSVLTIKGDRCNVKMLGKVSLQTGGSVLKVDPNNLGTEFSKIISDEIIGTNTEIVTRLNHRFRFVGTKDTLTTDHGRLLKDKIGNFTQETEISYQFDIITEEENKSSRIVNPQLFKCNRLPIQIQIAYTGRNSSRYLQVFTDWREVTDDAKEIVEATDFKVFSAGKLQQISPMIQQGKFDLARNGMLEFLRGSDEAARVRPELKEVIDREKERIKGLEKVMRSKQGKGGKGVSQPIFFKEEQEEEEELNPTPTSVQKDRRRRSRSRERDRSRSRGRNRSRSRSASRERDRARTRNKSPARDKKRKAKIIMDSDSEEQILWRDTRAKKSKKDH